MRCLASSRALVFPIEPLPLRRAEWEVWDCAEDANATGLSFQKKSSGLDGNFLSKRVRERSSGKVLRIKTVTYNPLRVGVGVGR
jgi:hypothetical protein